MGKPIAIYTDSAADLTPAERKELHVGLIPMSLVCGTDSFVDDRSVPMARLWERLEAGETLTTSQPSLQMFLDVFERARQRGQAVVLITISSALSGTFQTAQAAKSMADYDDIHVVDARSAAATAAEKMLVLRACALRDQGALSAAEIAEELKRFRYRVRLYACINTLEYLVRGGRLSKMAGSVGSILSIKPIISLSKEGEVRVVKKVQGLKRAMAELCATVERLPIDPVFPVIPIFAKDPANCESFLAQLESRLGIKTRTSPQEIGATIGCHIGPGGFGIVYVQEKRAEPAAE